MAYTSVYQWGLRRRVSSPAIWGKLPSHTDYVRHHAAALHAQDWQDWLSSHVQNAPWGQAQSATGRTSALAHVPVAFVLPPGHLPFSGHWFVQGVMLASCDAIGRSCPLLVYQLLHPRWFKQMWLKPHGRHSVFAAQAHLHLLYWWARWVARAHASGLRFEQVVQGVQQLWQLHQPTWRELMGAKRMPIDKQKLERILLNLGAHEHLDSAQGLHGTGDLPWVDWPEALLQKTAPALFWQQDMDGAYVNASKTWQGLARAFTLTQGRTHAVAT